LSDSIRSNEIIVDFKKLEEEYKSAKREKEIAILKKNIRTATRRTATKKPTCHRLSDRKPAGPDCIWLLMSRSRLHQRMKELEVRNNIAADLHDEVGSSSSSIHMLRLMAVRASNEADQQSILKKRASTRKKPCTRWVTSYG
jgi:signal transduction histidine kinase